MDNFVTEPMELSSDSVVQLENFFNLLIDLNILSREEAFGHECQCLPPNAASVVEGSEILVTPRTLPDQIEPSGKTTPPPQDLENEDEAWQVLQNLLIDPELARCRHLVVELTQKLADLESQIYQPTGLINLLLPVISELLSRKVTESKQSVADSLAPIIEQVVESKMQQEKVAMSSAIAPILPQAISHQISQSPEEVGRALAPEMAIAIKEQIRLDREAMANALAPEMGAAIKQQIMLERDAMVDALYPVIGSTISKYMAEAIRSINEQVENTLSFQGVTRKIRAKMQGVSEAELILKEAMPFTVRAIFLIHKTSGLVISEVQQTGSEKLESEMVAGMLTAIRSFVNDCIAQSGDISEIDAIDYGNSKIVLEVAGYCYLAAVIQGEPRQWFTRRMQQTLSTIVQRDGKSIKLFEGDPTTIPEQVKFSLEGLRDTASQHKSGKPPTLLIVGTALLSLILLPWGFYQYRHVIERDIEAATTSALGSAPELSVYRLSVDVNGETLKLSGRVPNQYLRRQAEQIAQLAVASNLKLDNQILAVEVPPDPVLAASEVKRVTSIWNRMDGIAISAYYVNGIVSVEGTVRSSVDAKQITLALSRVPGVRAVTNTVRIQPLTLKTRIYFQLASAELKSAELPKIVEIVEFLNQYPEQHLRIIGHSDRTGNPIENQQLALQRARTVQDALIDRGIARQRLRAIGGGTPWMRGNSQQALSLSRYVELKPHASVSGRK